jgi:AraC family transcriptional regulator
MEWSDRMNAAIAYIEDNLEREIDYNETASRANCSQSHFQRMFLVVIGVTPAEYARRRRLTLAARDLSVGNSKVLDVALKYGYDSPNAFTRAFKAIHGINPQEARTSGVKRTAYPRITFHIALKGGSDMDYRIIEKPAFDVVGKIRKWNMANGEFQREARKFWKKFGNSQEYQTMWDLTNGRWGNTSDAPLMSVYLPNENGTWDPMVEIFGLEKPKDQELENFEVIHVPAATYAEFHCTMATSAKVNKQIYREWFPSTGYERDAGADIAAYFPVAFRPQVRVRWWIPIVNKKQ